MECVCGCGTELSRRLSQRNFLAASVALELLAWDKNRASPVPGPDGREGLIARGADCYQRLLYALHEEGAGDPDEDCNEWLKESAAMRAGLGEMNRWKLLGQGPVRLSQAEVEQLDRKHPETSFTGRSGDTDKLGRLRALHAEGVLSDDELAAAEARLTGRN